ncbi:YppG family protein [Tenuibacillus multivorans]|uniref:YppG-like protein n=1 Tax=Tenuibacillus multivorans TaxID=237069 RepID=A0A1H0B9R3_9BACI|nr:YppG family protein [Tenuibacillus multivorans]GEL78591.1 hypothetical protein TMU01_28260 [Tenuibacillus multivorans]SDN42342.1 YppG-like protein [Tenuibacillus multivorans]
MYHFQSQHENGYYPVNYYYPSYYDPTQQQQPYYYPYNNYNQPLYFEVPSNEGTQYQNFQNQQSPFIQYFQDDNGEVDIDKVINTTNQFVKTAAQVGPMVKSLNNFVKGMKF